ncbi:hypothetical protein HTV45_05655 [Streptomyces sp. CHD11]|uniref:hypothetical protein n=1 Tax=Streptomyces sp. CHD11 TaxID=2741325 RepID=UPI001BFC77A6|nr:hypothetical protein [Streptomyces sp. CHD11]MBT3150380.1 hypothetical protein [Streptomyces sp. CHD11]
MLTPLTSRRVEVTAAAAIPVAVDGEALKLPTPVVRTVRPRALCVLAPRDGQGAAPPEPPLDRRRIVTLVLGRSGRVEG